MSRKLTVKRKKMGRLREQETYAIILALQKWESWIGVQPVLILTDQKILESWSKEVLDTPSGPLGRRARWHQFFSRFYLTMGYIPGKENMIPDILSRWAYPAGQAFRDICKQGTVEDQDEMKEIIKQEREEERQCLWVKLKNLPTPTNLWIRNAKSVTPDKLARFDECGTGQCEEKTPTLNHSLLVPKGKRVNFKFTEEQFHKMNGALRYEGITPTSPGINESGRTVWPTDPLMPPLETESPSEASSSQGTGQPAAPSGAPSGNAPAGAPPPHGPASAKASIRPVVEASQAGQAPPGRAQDDFETPPSEEEVVEVLPEPLHFKFQDPSNIPPMLEHRLEFTLSKMSYLASNLVRLSESQCPVA